MADNSCEPTTKSPLALEACASPVPTMSKPSLRLRKTRVMNQHLNNQLFGADPTKDLFVQMCHQSKSLYCRDLLAHYGCVNALEFSDDGSLFVSGSDDMRVLLWPISEALTSRETPSPFLMEAEHSSNIFCLAINPDNSRIYSGGNDQKIIIHDMHTKKPLDYVLHCCTVFSIALQPGTQGQVFASASEDGKLRVFDTRIGTNEPVIETAKRLGPLHSAMFSPADWTLLASAGAKDGTDLLDIRSPTRVLHSFPSAKGTMSVRFNGKGTRLLCLERRHPPIIYDVPFKEEQQKDGRDSKLRLLAPDFTNDCTLKSACFAGIDDELAVAGSDNHGVYIWSVNRSVEEPLLVLKGHRSIVNNVRYNGNVCTLASSGVEKMIKLWAPVHLPHSTGGLDESGVEETASSLSRRRYRDLTQGNRTGRPDRRSTDEDVQMLAFFDVLTSQSHDAHRFGGDSSDSSDDDDYGDSSSDSDSARIMAFFDLIGSEDDSSDDNASGLMLDPSSNSSSSSSSSSSDDADRSSSSSYSPIPSAPPQGAECLRRLQQLLARFEEEDDGGDDDDGLDSSSGDFQDFLPPVFLGRQLRQRRPPSSSSSSSNDSSP